MQTQAVHENIRIIVMVLMTGYIMSFTPAYSATLSVENGNAETGTQTIINVVLSVDNRESVSAIQFDVNYNPDISSIVSITVGEASLSAQKQVQYNIIFAGQVRVIIAGLNQNSIPSGSIAQISFKICASAPAGSYDISLTRAVLSSPTGSSVPVSVVNGTLVISRSLFHSADTNRDWKISLSEVLRVIQLYNSDSFYCACDTEDGYGLTGGSRNCFSHNSDYYGTPNWKIQLYEILRLIQIYNYGSYRPAIGTEDGFALGTT